MELPAPCPIMPSPHVCQSASVSHDKHTALAQVPNNTKNTVLDRERKYPQPSLPLSPPSDPLPRDTMIVAIKGADTDSSHEGGDTMIVIVAIKGADTVIAAINKDSDSSIKDSSY